MRTQECVVANEMADRLGHPRFLQVYLRASERLVRVLIRTNPYSSVLERTDSY